MRVLLLLLLAASARAQVLTGAQVVGNPQYQLRGQNYSTEAPAIQQMFYNLAGALNSTNQSALASHVIVGSSEPAAGIPANVTTFTGVSTFTATNFRGNRPGLVTASLVATDSSGGARTYTCEVQQNGVILDASSASVAASATTIPIVFIKIVPSTPAGTVNYVLICKSDSAATTQTYNNVHVNAIEF